MNSKVSDKSAPAEYAPGEVWQAQNGNEWFVVFEPGHDEPHMVNDVHMLAPSSFIEESYGPLTRKYAPSCESCDICGAFPCRRGCWTGEFLGEQRHRCIDEDACQAAFNHIAEVTR